MHRQIVATPLPTTPHPNQYQHHPPPLSPPRTCPERLLSSAWSVLIDASTLSTSVTTRGTDTMISTMLFSSPALMLVDTACSFVATVDRCVSRPLKNIVAVPGGWGTGAVLISRMAMALRTMMWVVGGNYIAPEAWQRYVEGERCALRLQTEKLTTEKGIRPLQVGNMIKLVSERRRQQCKGQYGTGAA